MDYIEDDLKEKRVIRCVSLDKNKALLIGTTYRRSNEIQSNHHQRTICFFPTAIQNLTGTETERRKTVQIAIAAHIRIYLQSHFQLKPNVFPSEKELEQGQDGCVELRGTEGIA